MSLRLHAVLHRVGSCSLLQADEASKQADGTPSQRAATGAALN